MTTITLPKIEYLKLKKEVNAYRNMKAHLFESLVQDPVDKVIQDFARTKLYSKAFLQDLEKGLRRSSYGK
jgi:hypothetical protein